MKIKDNQLIKMPYFKTFDHAYNIEESSLLLDNMKVYALNNNMIDREISFDIIVNPEEKYILPRCNPKKYGSFLLAAEKFVMGTMVEIKANEMPAKTKYN